MFCALFRLSNNTALGKKQYFVGSVYFRSNRLWVRWEIEHSFNGMLSQKYSYQKLLKFDNPTASYN